ncbi:hypothetical protein V8B97DRAFT_1919619 [Scleroderma yunnanense]
MTSWTTTHMILNHLRISSKLETVPWSFVVHKQVLLEGLLWDQHPPEDDTIEYGDSILIMINMNDAKVEAPTTLMYSWKSSYNVTVGDLVQVVQGQHWGQMGVVVSMDFHNTSIEIYNGSKVSNWVPLSLGNRCDVWVITGDKKGCLVQLVSLGHQSSIISILGYPNFQIKNTDIVTR